MAFWLQVNRRFNKIEGKHLALVISLNLFVAVIPLLIIIFAFITSFSANRSFGFLLDRDLHLTGSSALVVRDTFTSASSGKSVALSISVISLLVTGLDVSATAQVAYARAFTMTPLRGLQKYLRGAAWLFLLLADTVIVLALRRVAASQPVWFTIAAGVVLLILEFLFYLVTPRLLLELPFKWRDLVPGAAVCTGAAVIVHAALFFFFRRWIAEYGHAYGGFGVSLALIAAIGIVSSFWIWIAAVMGVYWERKAGPAVVAAMEKLSAEISAPEEEATVSEKAAGLYSGCLTLRSRTPVAQSLPDPERSIVERLGRARVLPVLTVTDPRTAEGACRALADAGLPCVEITYRTAVAS